MVKEMQMQGQKEYYNRKKTSRRIKIINQLMEALRSDEIYKTIDYRRKTEDYIKSYMHKIILNKLMDIHNDISPGLKHETLEKKAKESLIWESDVKTTVNNILPIQFCLNSHFNLAPPNYLDSLYYLDQSIS